MKGALASIVLIYAHALQLFNPNLDASSASTLAAATIREADAQALDARLLVALIAVESSWQSAAVSPAGARGLGQFMPSSAGALGVNPDDALESIHGVAVHLRKLLRHYASLDREDRYIDALAAYNAGSGAVDRYGGIPPYPETRAYVVKVMGLWRRLASE